MTSALAAEFERRKQSAACKRSRLRRAGLIDYRCGRGSYRVRHLGTR